MIIRFTLFSLFLFCVSLRVSASSGDLETSRSGEESSNFELSSDLDPDNSDFEDLSLSEAHEQSPEANLEKTEKEGQKSLSSENNIPKVQISDHDTQDSTTRPIYTIITQIQNILHSNSCKKIGSATRVLLRRLSMQLRKARRTKNAVFYASTAGLISSVVVSLNHYLLLEESDGIWWQDSNLLFSQVAVALPSACLSYLMSPYFLAEKIDGQETDKED